ncbi:sensor histidine kinase [Mariniplasma anaerobium]|uniref:histidine kinase n=1 Tax=Mariniplasma anaerobium TaxID=2735436 RepID=A0A7U9XVL2_9MOLU|nr:HAMP domain-containing sensor histidine kinase [Mariniplasma anaerobium]BCR36652.1 histidine kinase [Mariniplasma anaerobium]
MFKKLIKRMLILNVVIISSFLFIVLGTLYTLSYVDINARIQDDLDKILEFSVVDEPVDPLRPPGLDPFNLERTVSFVVFIDPVTNELTYDAQFTTDLDFIDSAYELVDDNHGDFQLDEITWSYKSVETPDGTKIAFLDTTNEQGILDSSLIRYIVIFVISTGLTALISWFLTRKAVQPVKESFDKQKQFISDASHELKTPLTIMNTNVDILLAEQKNSKWLKYIKSEVTRMTKLTHDLLYLASVSETDQINMAKSSVDVSEAVESIMLGMEALAFEKEVELIYDIKTDKKTEFNSEEFHQLIMILLDNAIKYTPKKGHINLNVYEKNKHTYLSIKNTGTGIDPKDLDRIFDRFYKTDKSRVYTSNSFGLGLSIAQSICEHNDARITCDSKLNEYTEFEIKLKISHK